MYRHFHACATPLSRLYKLGPCMLMHALLVSKPVLRSLQVLWYEDQNMVRVKCACELRLAAHANSTQEK